MIRITSKHLMLVAWLIALVIVCATGSAQAQPQQGTPVGPGVAGQVHAAAYDPLDPNTVYVGSDCAGVLVTHNHGVTWSPFNAGLENADLAATSYVDDLLVLRDGSGEHNIDDNWEGVYAATHGGIFFNDGSGWRPMTPYGGSNGFRYSGGFASLPPSTTDLNIPIPFSTLAFDKSTGVLYAGAGMGRREEGGHARDNYYPDGTNTISPRGLHSLWKCSLVGPSPSWDSIPNAGNWGIVRQIAIVSKSGHDSKVALATRDGVHLGTVTSSGWVDEGNVWTDPGKLQSVPMDEQAMEYWTENAWGVGGGFDGILYVAKMAVFSDQGVKLSDPGVYSLDVFAGSGAHWAPVGAEGQSVFMDGVTPNRGAMTWGDVIHAVDLGSNHVSTLLGLTVIPGNGTTADELFVGERTLTTNTGCFRYGPDPSRGNANHWLYVLYMDSDGSPGLVFDNFTYHAVNCFSPSGTPTDTQFDPGWASNNPLSWTVPLIIHPLGPRRMMAFAYHFPMAFDSPASGWGQRNCTGSGSTQNPDNGSWTSNGLNMMGVTAIAFAKRSDRLVLADEDFTGFMSTNSEQSAFKWLDWYADGLQDGRDIATLEHDGAERVLLVRGAPEKSIPISGGGWQKVDFGFARDRQKYVVAEYDPSIGGVWDSATKNGYNWKYLSRQLDDLAFGGDPFKVADIEVAGPDTLFAACVNTGNSGSRIFRGIYDGLNVSWTLWKDFVESAVEQRRVVQMRRLPASRKLLVGVADVEAGVYCLDVDDSTAPMTAWLRQGAISNDYQKATLEHLTMIECDRMGRVVYVGTRGEVWDLDANYYGAVWQLTIPTGRDPVSSDWRLIANATPEANSFDFGTVSADGFWRWTSEGPGPRLTWVQDIEIDPGNPYKVYVGLSMSGLRGQGTFNFSNAVWSTTATPGPTTPAWTRVFPAPGATEPIRGASALAIDPNNRANLYVGTPGQEMYRTTVPVSPSPIIESLAAYPLLAGAVGQTHVFAVTINDPEGAAIDGASVYLAAIGGRLNHVPLFDDGVDPDLDAGDHVFTSRRFAASPEAPGSYIVQVWAHATNGCYELKDVNVAVVASATAPVITPTAVYPMRAGSTDASRVLAVEVSTPAATTRVTADITGLGGTGSVRLRDDGKNDDIKVGDGIYTSAPFVAGMTNGGSFNLAVTAAPMTGSSVSQVVAVTAVAATAKFTNVAGTSTGALSSILTEIPYSSVYFKSRPGDPNSDDLMVVTFDNDPYVTGGRGPRILKQRTHSPGDVPAFDDMTTGWLGFDGLPKGGRGVCYADYDNDGDNDLFICNVGTQPKLLENQIADGHGFVDRTDVLFQDDSTGDHRSALNGSIAASWGDYNGDGFVDLFVSTTSYSSPIASMTFSALSAQSPDYAIRIFRNVNGTGFQRTFMGTASTNSVNICLAGCWADLDNNGDLDLVTTNIYGRYFTVFANTGYNPAWGDNVLYTSAAWSVPSSGFVGANSVSMIDYDHDPYPDLLITEALPEFGFRTRIMRNNYADNHDKSFTPVDVGTATDVEWSGATVADFDLDGQEDILLHPKAQDVLPRLFMAAGYGNAPTYVDRSYMLGLRDGRTGGALAADFDGDHKIDLFMGRESGDQFLYRNDAQGTTPNHWIGVTLRSLGNSNKSLIGTKVIVTAGTDKRWMRIIDGGSGRGGQDARPLIFGLGEVASGVNIRVEFPSGDIINPEGHEAPDQVHEIIENSAPVFVAGSTPVCDYELGPGVADFIFKWRTAGNKGDITLDEVVVKNFNRYATADPCYIGIGANAEKRIGWGDQNVKIQVYRDGAEWQHVLRWQALPCAPNCLHSFKVKSAVGTASTPTTSFVRTTATTFCVQPDEDPNQP